MGTENRGPCGRMTASFGGATTVPIAIVDPSSIVKAASSALRRAKEEGRNRVRIEGAPGHGPSGLERSEVPN